MGCETIAKAFHAHVQAGAFDKAEALWADDIVSLEAAEGDMARVEGRAAVHAKGEWWNTANTVHAMTASAPLVNGDQFLMQFHMEFTPKESGEKRVMDETALYTVKNGKIVEERFFY